MDISQLAQTVMWLEDERRRDKAEIERLQELVQSTHNETTEQATRIKELEARLLSLTGQVTRTSNIEAAVEKAKRELSLMVQQAEARVQATEREAFAARQNERETILRAVENIRLEVQKYAQYEKPIESHRIELQRLGEQIARLQHQVNEGLSQVNTRLQSIAYLEDLIRRNERDIHQLQTLDAEIRQQQQLGGEAIQKLQIELQRQINSLVQETKAQRTIVEAIGPRITSLQEQQDSGRAVLAEIKVFEERIQRQQDQAAERQRLAEERQKRELSEWQTDNEKRWRRLEVITEQRWANQQREHQELVDRLKIDEERSIGLVDEIEWLWRAQREFAYHRVSEVQKWITEFEKLLDERDRSSESGGNPPAPGFERPEQPSRTDGGAPNPPARRV